MTKVVLTGAAGLLGWHAQARLHALNRAARFSNKAAPFEIIALDHPGFNDDRSLSTALAGAEIILHFAGVNRGDPGIVERSNPEIAHRLVTTCRTYSPGAHIVFANSIHAELDTPYGRSKRVAAEIIGDFNPNFTNLMLPHVFGEFARADYNSVTATFIDRVIRGIEPIIAEDGTVYLVHAGRIATVAITAGQTRKSGDVPFASRKIGVPELYEKISSYGRSYRGPTIPELNDSFEVELFNSFRAALFPLGVPNVLSLSADHRGVLFEAVKSRSGGQTFLSWTDPGVTRGNHFHLQKVERFLVLQGEARIRVRRILADKVHVFDVTGRTPSVVDIPTLHTHSIENIGSEPLLTLFWANDIFDPTSPDTYAESVLAE